MLNFWSSRAAAKAARHDSRSASASPARRAAGPASRDPGGLLAGTQVASASGWVAVEDLKVGDVVMTFDNGPQTICAVTRQLYPYGLGRAEARPLVIVPAGLLGNTRTLAMLPEQVVLAESDMAEALLGDPFAPLYADALTAQPGVAAVLPEASACVVTLGFERDEAIFVEGQALAVCPSASQLAPATLDEALFSEERRRYVPLRGLDAVRVAASITATPRGPAATH